MTHEQLEKEFNKLSNKIDRNLKSKSYPFKNLLVETYNDFVVKFYNGQKDIYTLSKENKFVLLKYDKILHGMPKDEENNEWDDDDDEWDDDEETETESEFASYHKLNKLREQFLLLKVLSDKNVTFDSLSIFLHPGDLLKEFIRNIHHFDDKQYWKTLRDIYTMHDSNQQHTVFYTPLFISNRKYKSYLMSTKEKSLLKSLPDKVKIYRGMSADEAKGGKYGISWSLNKSIAVFFAKTYFRAQIKGDRTVVKQKTINKKDITAYFADRNEEEIIYLK